MEQITKDSLKEILKEMFKEKEINIYVTNETDDYYKSITTTVEVWIDGECVAKESDSASFDN